MVKSFNNLPFDYQNKIMPEPMSGCWIWTGSLSFNGYGRKRAPLPNPTANVVAVHREVYKMLVGPIPDGKQLDHLCRIRSCCNPSHLEPVTCQENIRRGTKNQYTKATCCPQGHPYSGENLVTYFKNGRECRLCRICKRAILRRWRARKGIGHIAVENPEIMERSYLLGEYRKWPNYEFRAEKLRTL